MADERDGFARPGFKRNVLEHPAVRRRTVVAKRNMLENEMPSNGWQRLGTRAIFHLWFRIEQLEDSLGTGRGRQHSVVKVAHSLDRAEEHPEIKDERCQLADGDLV